ncbi:MULTISPECIES: CPBP family intramembrane glutamic endopeptidase [Anoxybacillus]|uniref:CAAX amino terminal protease self-immunity n=1 Tax=Anoxybacillus ayderensis TaxID=265546 RepID=A0A0D0G677_9BACL|nr:MULTISPECIES: CPBP family intramembrane glutamic endopeptidase [Anoxybacillus]EPZ38461.1 metal-dependent membrane protease, CAAX family [Anoxybacillus ayderensis]KIP20840.1 CAAX amino terminal protease self- immunity [Anoxybacillus ayderensis]NNU96645.1 CPBP family intramembrane metalloprotease [Anoxybacillus sp. EFIL]
MIKKQIEIANEISEQEIVYHLYFTQALIFLIALALGIYLFTPATFFAIWQWDVREILLYGGGCAALVLFVDFLLIRYVPEQWYDDGGINEKLFRSRSVPHIFIMTAIIAFCEELLFRGVIQTHVGLLFASVIFGLLHIRYWRKWLLLVAVVSLSFWIGFIYEWTGNLWVTIFAHFLIDFILALHIRYRTKEVNNDA